MQFSVFIPQLAALQEALANYTAIATPILQNAVVAAQAILAKFTNASTVPIKTGYLSQHWGFAIGNLQASYYPKANYAPFVEFPTAPHIIKAVNARVLANKQTGQIFGPLVHHPGTRANPFMERIIQVSTPEITTLFETALTNITAAIASQPNS